MKTVFGMKKRSSCDSAHVGRQFFQIKASWAPFLPVLSGVCPDFRGFCPNFQEFFPDFHHIKILGVRLHPLHPRLLHH